MRNGSTKTARIERYMRVTRKTIVQFVLAIAVPLLVGAGATAQSPQKGGTSPKTLVIPLQHDTELLSSRAVNDYLTGLVLSAFDEPDSAVAYYQQALAFYPRSYEIRYGLAEAYFALRQPAAALDALNGIPDKDASVYLMEGTCHRALGDEDSARAAYVAFVKLDPSNPMVLSYLVGAFLRKNDIDSTIWAYRNLAHYAASDNPRVWNELAKLEAQQGRLDSAEVAFSQSLELDTTVTNIMALVGLGEVYEQSGKLDSAAMTFNRGLRIDPDNIVLHRELIMHYLRQDSLAEALPHSQAEVRLAPLDRSGVRRLGLIYYGLDSLGKADSIFSYLVNSGALSSIDHAYLGRIAVQQKQYEKARDEFSTAADLADTSYDSWIDLGFAYRMLNDTAKEIAAYVEGLKHVKDDQGVLRLNYALGSAYDRAGRTPEAVALFEKILAKNPDQAEALNDLGYMLADRNERLDYAKQLISKAIKIEPDNAAYLDSYGWVYYRLGDYGKALEYLTQAAAKVDDATIFEHLGDTYKAMNEPDSARSWWEKALKLSPDNSTLKEKLGN
jgi:tetratricopeptide (TPR) repeat protein